MRNFFVYILASPSRTLYTGITNDLLRRIYEHRNRSDRAFTSRYGATRLVHFESTCNPAAAITRKSS